MNDFVEIRHYFSIFLRRWWILLLSALIAASIGYVVSQRQERVYRATTSVIVGQSIQATQLDSRDIQTSERLALTYADIARRQPVLEATIISLNLDYFWQDLRDQVRVDLVPDTQLLEISVESTSREEAVRLADELAQQLILISPTSLQNPEDENARLFVRERLQDLQKKIEGSQAQLDELTSALAAASTPEEKAQIQTEMNDIESLLVGWENTYARFLQFVGSEESANYIAVVDKAHANFNPVRPSVRLNTMIAGLVGFMLAAGVIFLREYLDDTVKEVDDIGLNLTQLGTISQFGNGDFQGKMIVSDQPLSPVAESYRMVRSNIQFMLIDNPGRAILVTSPVPGDGKTTTAVNLAIAMAHDGNRTVLVDADLRNPDLHEFFDLPNSNGLTDQLRRQSELGNDIYLHQTKEKNLQLLTAGVKASEAPNPSELLGSQRMKQLVDSLIFEADVVIIDSPPAAYITDAAILSTIVDGVVLVVSAGKTKREDARQAVFNLAQADANILGVVLNGMTEKRGGYYYAYGSSTQELSKTGERILAGLQQAWTTLTLAVQRLRREEEIEQDQDTTPVPEEGKEVTHNIP